MQHKNTIFINTRITPAQKKAFDKRAKFLNRKPADVLRMIIADYVKSPKEIF